MIRPIVTATLIADCMLVGLPIALIAARRFRKVVAA